MRPEILNSGYSLGTKILFRVIRLFSHRELPDAAKLVFYRRDFYGNRMGALAQQVMRGESEWSVGERELMAAAVSHANSTAFCIGAHTATAARAIGDRARVEAVLADAGAAPEPLRSVLNLIKGLTRDNTVATAAIRAALDAGASRQQLEDAFAIAFAFNVTDRLADAFSFAVLDAEGFDAGAKHLLSHGYA